MTRQDVREVLEKCGGPVEDTPQGLTFGPLRVESGGGIAGNLDMWWITAPGEPEWTPIGPLRLKRELAAELKALVLDSVRLGEALRRLVHCREYNR